MGIDTDNFNGIVQSTHLMIVGANNQNDCSLPKLIDGHPMCNLIKLWGT